MDRSSSVVGLLPKISRVVSAVIVLAALSCVWGCAREGAQPSEPPAERPTALRLAYGKKIHYAPQIIALKQGYFADAALAIDAKVVQAGIQAAEALTSGSADIAVMGDAPAIIAAASGVPVKIIASYGGGERMHRLIAGPKSAITTPAGLKGKRVGIQMGSSTHGAFLLFLDKNGLSADDLVLVPLNPSDMPEAMLANQIDAGVGSEPWPSNIEERVEGSSEVATLANLGNNYPLVMLVTARYAQAHPEAVLAALRATLQAVDLMHTDPDRAAGLIAEATGVPVERERRIMDTLEWGVVLDDATINSLQQTADFLYSQGKTQSLPDWDKVVDRSFTAQLGL
jgi:sulfonate transport system substrate-binding protein